MTSNYYNAKYKKFLLGVLDQITKEQKFIDVMNCSGNNSSHKALYISGLYKVMYSEVDFFNSHNPTDKLIKWFMECESIKQLKKNIIIEFVDNYKND